MPTTTVRIEIKDSDINDAIAKAKTGMPTGEIVVYSDSRETGLQLRVQGKQAFWALKYFNWTKTLGYAHPPANNHLSSISAARKLAGSAKEILDDDPAMFKPLLNKYYGSASGDVKKARKEMVATSAGWTLLQTAEEMFEARTKPDTDNPMRLSYANQIRRTLRRKELKELIKKPIADITKGDCDTIKRELEKNGEGVSAIKKFVSDIRTILTYGAEHATGETGLDPNHTWWELLKSGKKSKPSTRKPILDDLVKTLILAEEYLHKSLPGRTDGKRGVRQNVYNSLWWLCLTAQRATAGTRLRLVDFFPDPKRPNTGWYLAFWAEGETKNDMAFVLPIPPRASEFVKDLLARAKRAQESEWCFPSERGKDDNDIPVNRNSPGAVIERLAARDYPTASNKEMAKIAVDLLAANGVMYWSPHDIRRTLVEITEEHGIPGGASAVLAHEVKLTDDLLFDDNARNREQYLELRVARVTKLAYGAGQFVPLKSRAMEVWTNAILDRYEELSPKAQDLQRKRHQEQLIRYIFSDASAAEQARERAMETLGAKQNELEMKLAREEEALAGFKANSPANIALIKFAQEGVDIAREAVEVFNRNPAFSAIGPSRENGVRGMYTLLRLPGQPVVNLEKHAPEYTEMRDRYISGEIDYLSFLAEVTARYQINFNVMEDNILIADAAK